MTSEHRVETDLEPFETHLGPRPMAMTPACRSRQVFDLELPLDQAADGYRAMDQRDAIKVLLRP